MVARSTRTGVVVVVGGVRSPMIPTIAAARPTGTAAKFQTTVTPSVMAAIPSTSATEGQGGVTKLRDPRRGRRGRRRSCRSYFCLRLRRPKRPRFLEPRSRTMSGAAEFTMSSASSSRAATSAALGLGLGDVVALLERADLPAGVHHPAREAGAVVRAAPRRLGREVDAALPHDLAVGVRPALVVPAVHPHRHGRQFGRRSRSRTRQPVSRASRPPASSR